MSDGRHILLSSARQDWRSPGWFLDLVRRVGPIEFDPCTELENPTGAEHHVAQVLEWHPPLAVPRVVGPCGLRSPWERRGLAYINPPYGPQLSGPVQPDYPIWRTRKVGDVREVVGLVGVGRGWAARIAQETGECLVLVPVRTETAWWRLLHAWCDEALLWSSPEHGPRIAFVDPDTGAEKGGSNLASTVFYRGPRRARFRAVFGPHGTLIPGAGALERQLRRPARRRGVPTLARSQMDLFALGDDA